MLQDILNTKQTKTVEGKEYSFEYDFASLAALEKDTKKSPYVIFEELTANNNLMLEESLALVRCGMIKHHSDEEILELLKKIKSHAGLWYELKEPVAASFLVPMLPPEVMRKAAEASKKNSKKKA